MATEKLAHGKGKWLITLLFACFFLSGLSALIYEVVWTRMLMPVLGSTLSAISMVLTVYMGGLALGSYWAGKKADLLQNPIIVYALLELGLGGYALFIPFLFSVLNSSAMNSSAFQELHLVSVVLVLLLPTCIMGATFPVMARIFAQSSFYREESLGELYAVNTAGAFFGTIVTGFLLVPTFGLSTSVYLAACLNFMVGALALVIRHRVYLFIYLFNQSDNANLFTTSYIQNIQIKNTLPSSMVPIMLAVIGISAALSMVLEVVWTRFFVLVFGCTTYGLTAVLASVLVGIALGACLGTKISRKISGEGRQLLLVLAAVFFAAGGYIYLLLASINELPWILIQLSQVLNKFAPERIFETAILTRLLVAALAVIFPAAMCGAVFPLTIGFNNHLVIKSKQVAGSCLGQLYAINTLGAIIGTLLAGYVLIPKLSMVFNSGMQASLILVFFALLLLGLIMVALWMVASPIPLTPRLTASFVIVSIVIVGLACLNCSHLKWNRVLLSSGVSLYSLKDLGKLNHADFMRGLGTDGNNAHAPKMLFYREGINSTVTVTSEPRHNVTFLKNDGKVEAGVPTDISKPAPTSDFVTQILLGALPVLLHQGPVRDALVIGYGSGTTCGSVLNFPEVSKLTIAELEPAVFAADGFFAHANNRPLRPSWHNSRVLPAVADARNFLLSKSQKYDLIISQPGDPWVNGMTNLFTVNFWSLVRRRLNTNGMFCQWIQLYAIDPEYLGVLARTFRQVFPDTLVFYPPDSGELILVGFTGPIKIDQKMLSGRFVAAPVYPGSLKVGYKNVDQILATAIAGPIELEQLCQQLAKRSGDGRINTDDNLLTEYQLPARMYSFFGIHSDTFDVIQTMKNDFTGISKRKPKRIQEIP